jgi:oxaloacetate decarboxylase (Na+ extruding) subunit alpha
MSTKLSKSPLSITELVLRDAHQSLFATRLRIEDMLPIAAELDKIGYWSLETWGGATFDSCIRYLGEDPWERLRKLKAVMPNTKQQMLFRAQNILGYRHYADDVVHKFVERAADNGMDVFRIFDAMNDMRNLTTAVAATKAVDKHAQGTISYTVSPVHTIEKWLDMAKQIEDMGADSLCIKDMAGLLKPYVAEELVAKIKQTIKIPVALHCHATTGLSTATLVKAVEAGVDIVDTAISSMSMTYGHSATESLVAIYQGTDKDSGLDLEPLEKIAAYFREVRKKYAKFEGSLRGIDSRILTAQVPGGMLTNMENQLREQGAADKLDAVLAEIPRVRKDLGYIPLVTPTSQIVGTQSVINVLSGERYKSITKETAGVLKGEYGATAAPVNSELQAKVLDGAQPITCRPADVLEPELERLTAELKDIANEESIELAEHEIDDVLTYALFPQIGLKFLKHRNNPDMFEPAPSNDVRKEDAAEVSKPQSAASQVSNGPEHYDVKVNGKIYAVTVAPSGDIEKITEQQASMATTASQSSVTQPSANTSANENLNAPLTGNIFKVMVKVGDTIEAGQEVMILEAMKMETQVVARNSGVVTELHVKEGDAVSVGEPLLSYQA